MAAKLVKCKVCGIDMAANAKACPQCGAQNKKPIYKRWWLWLLIVILVGAIASGGNSEKAVQTPENNAPAVSTETENVPESISYTHYNITELFDTLTENALKAEKTFQNQYVEIEGYLSVIDSDGSYVSVGADPDDYEYFLQNIQCYTKKNEALLEQIIEMNVGDPVVVRGKITDIGEVLGYQMDLDSID